MLNVITGPAAQLGGADREPVVRKLSFTGSTAVGKMLMAAAGTIKKPPLELGGNAPFIVFDDADLDAAVRWIASKNTGQTCVCANRLLVQDGVYDAFAKKLADAVGKLKPAPGLEAGATQGPLIDDKAVEKVEEHVSDALAKGARLVVGGHRHALGGRFFEPTILADVTPAMLLAREETFGPVAPLFRFTTDEEAIRLANDTEFGLASSTRPGHRACGASPSADAGWSASTPGSSRPKSRRLECEGIRTRARDQCGIDSICEIKYLAVEFEDLRI